MKKTTKQQPAKGSSGQSSKQSNTMSKNKRPSSKPKSAQGPRLSKCAADYARCLANPFSGPLACVPSFPATSSLKSRVWIKGVFSTGTSGIGFIAADPSSMCVYNPPANAATFFTLPGFAGTDMNFGSANVGFASSNAVNAAGNVSPSGVVYRVVSCGLRIRYIGTELNRGGIILGLHDLNHNSLYERDFASIDGEINSVRFRVDREWKTVLYKPVIDTDDNFASAFPTFTPSGNDNSFYMGFIVSSPTATIPESYEYEIYGVYEFQGRIIRGQTPSHFDPVGYAAAHSVSQSPTQMIPFSGPAEVHEQSFLQKTVGYLEDGISVAGRIGKAVWDVIDNPIVEGLIGAIF